MHDHTACFRNGYLLHVHIAGGGKKYILGVHTAVGGKVYTLLAAEMYAGGKRETQCTAKLQVVESDTP
jgi:hypothetical protein